MEQKPNLEGTTYEILDFIGEGTYGKVYKAIDKKKNHYVAIK